MDITGTPDGETIPGTDDGETILAGGGDDIVHAGGGDDTIDGGDGKDQLFGEAGDDVITDTSDATSVDYAYGGEDDDRITGVYFAYGGSGADVLTDNGTFFAGARLDGGDGDDVIHGNGSTNVSYVTASAGVTVDLRIADAQDTVAAGTDTIDDGVTGIIGSSFADTLTGDDGTNYFESNGGADVLTGGLGDDTYAVDGGETIVEAAGGGTDTVRERDAASIDLANYANVENVEFDNGFDTSFGFGDSGDNVLSGNYRNASVLDGRGGNDTFYSRGARSVDYGGDGDDVVFGNAGDDQAYGGAGFDQLFGGGGNDLLDGGGDATADALSGGDGEDTLVLHGNGTQASGGAGSDTFVVTGGTGGGGGGNGGGQPMVAAAVVAGGIDTVSDFQAGAGGDRIDVSNLLGQFAGYEYGANPFGDGHLSFVQAGDDTLLQIDRDGGGDGWSDLVRLTGVVAADIVAANLSPGFSPDGPTATTETTLSEGDDDYTAGADRDIVHALAGADIVRGGFGDDRLEGQDGDDMLYGGEQDDALYGGGDADTLYGGAGADALYGGAGGDTFEASGGDTIYGGDGDDHVLDVGSVGGADDISGGDGRDSYTLGYSADGGYVADTVRDFAAGAGGDVVDLSVLAQGLGLAADANPFADGHVQLVADGADTLVVLDQGGGATYTVLRLANVAPASLTADNFGGYAPVTSAPQTIDDTDEAHTLYGGPAADTINGNGGDDIVYAGAGDDDVHGGADADTIYGGAGGDDLFGDDGNDIVYAGTSAVRSNALVNTLGGTAGFGEQALAPDDDNGISIDLTQVFGANGLNWFGTDRTSLTIANNGFLNFNGSRATNGTIDGGYAVIAPFWNDIDTRASTSQTPGGNSTGADRVWYDLDAQRDTLTVTWDDVGQYGNSSRPAAFQIQVTQNADGSVDLVYRYENITWSNNAAVGFSGGQGTVQRLPFDKNPQGQLDAPTTVGNTGVAGVWAYHISAGGTVSDGTAAGGDATDASNRLDGGAGDDRLYATDGGGNTLSGGDGADQLYGGAGADLLYGGDGADVIAAQGGDTAEGGIGDDLFVGLAGDGAADALSGGDGADVYPADTQPLHLVGNAYSNTISGNAGDNILEGAGGDDKLFGMGGADVLRGGTGNDIYFVNDARAQVYETPGQGLDTVLTEVDYTLTAGQEIETLQARYGAATTALALTGNGNDNTLIGNAGDNVLDGGGGSDKLFGLGGADTMRGGNGNDVFFVTDTTDRVFEAAGQGQDAVLTDVSFTLAAGQEIESLQARVASATTALALSGNEYANTIVGNAGANTLDGGAGDDKLFGLGGDDLMRGGTGNDLYFVTDAGYRVLEGTGQGTDAVLTDVSYTLEAGQEIERLLARDQAGTTALTLIGNEQRNLVVGNAAANLLDGGAGADKLAGNGGADTFRFDALSDFATGPTLDAITDFSSGDGDRIELVGIDAIAGGGDDAFSFIGTQGFTGVAGQLRYQAVGADLRVSGDVTGDGVADFAFDVLNRASLAQADFHL